MSNKNRLRQKRFEVKLLPEEVEIFTKKAERAGKNKSDYFRDFILFGNPIIRDKLNDIDADKISYELNRIGNNINQIAYQANLRCEVTKNDFFKLREEYDRLLELFVDNVLDR